MKCKHNFKVGNEVKVRDSFFSSARDILRWESTFGGTRKAKVISLSDYHIVKVRFPNGHLQRFHYEWLKKEYEWEDL